MTRREALGGWDPIRGFPTLNQILVNISLRTVAFKRQDPPLVTLLQYPPVYSNIPIFFVSSKNWKWFSSETLFQVVCIIFVDNFIRFCFVDILKVRSDRVGNKTVVLPDVRLRYCGGSSDYVLVHVIHACSSSHVRGHRRSLAWICVVVLKVKFILLSYLII